MLTMMPALLLDQSGSGSITEDVVDKDTLVLFTKQIKDQNQTCGEMNMRAKLKEIIHYGLIDLITRTHTTNDS